jgi:hypothetical protein
VGGGRKAKQLGLSHQDSGFEKLFNKIIATAENFTYAFSNRGLVLHSVRSRAYEYDNVQRLYCCLKLYTSSIHKRKPEQN